MRASAGRTVAVRRGRGLTFGHDGIAHERGMRPA